MKIGAMLSRLATNARMAAALLRTGVTPASVLLFPLRRRTGERLNRLDVRGGPTIRAPRREPLIFLFREIWIEQCYGTPAITARDGAAIVDVGAHVGVFALWAAKRYPGLRVVALEPAPQAFALLARNVRDNRAEQVIPLNVAAGGKRGEVDLLSRGPEMMSTLYGEGQVTARCEMLTLDDVIARHRIESIPLLKLDCEGAEYEILYGASSDALARVERIAMEYHVGLTEHDPDQLVSFLKGHGFQVRTRPSIDDMVHGYLRAWRDGGQ